MTSPSYIFSNQIFLLSIYISTQEIMLLDPLAVEIGLIYESCNLIGQEHFQIQKSSWFINASLKSSWYKNFAIWLAKSIFDLAQSKIYNFSLFFFFFFESISTCHKSSLFILFWDIDDLRILQSYWLRTLWLTTLEQEFSQIWDLYRRHKANNTRSGKKTTFWKKLLKSLRSVILHIFGEKNIFLEKLGSVCS